MNRHNDHGFTLVEVLIAVSVMAVVISAIYVAHQGTFRVVSGSLGHLNASVVGRSALERLTDDLQSMVLPPVGYLHGEEIFLDGGRADSLRFVSATHVPLRRNDHSLGHKLISYSVESDAETGLLNLYRSSMSIVPGPDSTDSTEGPTYLVAHGLREVRLRYLDDEGIFHDNWMSPTDGEAASNGEEHGNLPRLITVELRFPDERVAESEGTFLLRTAIVPPLSLLFAGRKGAG